MLCLTTGLLRVQRVCATVICLLLTVVYVVFDDRTRTSTKSLCNCSSLNWMQTSSETECEILCFSQNFTCVNCGCFLLSVADQNVFTLSSTK